VGPLPAETARRLSCDATVTRVLVTRERHHLRHWLHGGPTDLGNLVLLCRGHHHAVHEGGWRRHRHPDATLTATPPHRRQPTAA
jgi:hypothetical protein